MNLKTSESMRVLIIEDEAPAYRRLINMIREYDPSVEVTGIIQSVREGIEWLRTNQSPDLILSDIQLADDLSFVIFKELNITTPIIFITAFDDYAINAFKFYSVDYLLKPINQEDLNSSLDKYKSIHFKNPAHDLGELFNKLVEKKYRERFLVYFGDSLIPVQCSEIAYFLSEDGETMFYTRDGKRYFINESLDNIEQELNPEVFFRVNRQMILGIHSIDRIFNYGIQKLKITVKPEVDKEIIISKQKAPHFKNWLNR
jgi:DNA-binding LytR/AlgR family response regulator